MYTNRVEADNLGWRPWLVLITVLMAGSAVAHEFHPMKTRTLAEGAASAQGAMICKASWLAGHWLSSGAGTLSEEIWAPPIHGTIMGSFRSIRDGRVAFYEIMLITEQEGSLALKLRHFQPDDLRGWEQENGVAAVHKLLAWDANALYFDGVTFESVRPDLLRVHLRVVDPASKQVSEKQFDYRRVTALSATQPSRP